MIPSHTMVVKFQFHKVQLKADDGLYLKDDT